MPNTSNGNKEGDDNAQLSELMRQLQERKKKEKTIHLVKHDRNEQQQLREYRQQIEAQ